MTLEEFAARLRNCRKVVFFTGAGISTESGVPDFRSPGGVWTKYQPVLFQDFVASEAARIQHWQLKKATYELFKTVKPNIGHFAIRDFELRGQLLGLITQNIDGLHSMAGTSRDRLAELHGTNSLVECQSCHSTLLVPEAGTFKCPRCSAIFSHSAGRSNFLPRRKMAPLQLTLSSTPECTEALCYLVSLFCAKMGMSAEAIESVPGAVREAVGTIVDLAYGKNDQCTYQVLLVLGDTELSLKIADYGKRIDPNSTNGDGAPVFAYTRTVMDVFDLKSHPKGGNILTIAKRI